MSYTRRCIGLALALGLAALYGAYAAETLPFVNGFETGLGANWTQSGDGTATVSSAAAKVGGNGLSVSNKVVTLSAGGGSGDTNVWVHLMAKPAVSDDSPSMSGITSAAFYLKNDKSLMAYTGGVWTAVQSNVPSNTWLGFVVHLNYIDGIWDLFVCQNPTGTNDVFARVGTSPLYMGTARSNRLSEVVVDSEIAMSLDVVGGSYGYTQVGAAELDTVMVRSTHAGVATNFVPNIGTHSNDVDTLYARLGKNLLSGVQLNDELMNIGTNGASLYRVENVGGGVLAWGTIQGALPENLHWTMGTGGTLVRGAGNNALAFMEYDGALQVPPASQTVGGPDYGGVYGWNQVVNPEANGTLEGGGHLTADAEEMFPGAVLGDEVWWRDGNSFHHWVYLSTGWDTSQGSIPGGAMMWFRRRADGTEDWVPNIR
ncbi:MAG: hypothetical protein FJ225_03905 [Lentisphaerae bacterium]|nr:hypothetical protein [Lentisphaerota bacterium]